MNGDHVALVLCPACEGTGTWSNGLQGPNADWGDCSVCDTEGTVSAEDARRWEQRQWEATNA